MLTELLGVGHNREERIRCVHHFITTKRQAGNMPKVTLLARLSDGLPLAASMADENDAYAKEVRQLEHILIFLFRNSVFHKNATMLTKNWGVDVNGSWIRTKDRPRS